VADRLGELGVVPGARAEQHPEGVGALGHEAEVGPEAGLDLAARALGGRGLEDGFLELAADVDEQLREQLPLRREVLVEHGLGDPGRLGDLVHRGAAVAVCGEHGQCPVEQLATAFTCRKTSRHGAPEGQTETLPGGNAPAPPPPDFENVL
jgi:hypothetical protein